MPPRWVGLNEQTPCFSFSESLTVLPTGPSRQMSPDPFFHICAKQPPGRPRVSPDPFCATWWRLEDVGKVPEYGIFAQGESANRTEKGVRAHLCKAPPGLRLMKRLAIGKCGTHGSTWFCTAAILSLSPLPPPSARILKLRATGGEGQGEGEIQPVFWPPHPGPGLIEIWG
jgi:hypothetical protein